MCQRLKLATDLRRSSKTQAIYVLTSRRRVWPADPGRVIDILDRLVDAGAQSWSSSTASTSSIEPTESSTSAPTPVTASVRISWKLELSSRDVTPLKDQSRDFSIQLVEGLGAASLLNVHHRGERRLVSCLRVGPVTLSAEIRGVLLL